MSSQFPNIPGFTSATKQSPTSNTKPNRLPAPTLFVGPPSRNASQLSVSRPAIDANLRPGGHPGIERQKTARSRIYSPEDDGDGDEANKDTLDVPVLKKSRDKSVDAKWRELQSTLNEVELTAQSSTHVFGEHHVKALDELRSAQIALARAWGRNSEVQEMKDNISEVAPEVIVGRFKGAEDLASDRQKAQNRARADTGESASTVLSDESQLSEGSIRSGTGQLEDETAQDIKLASERRAANEAYFQKVDQGVKEVVEKLEKVAEAMRGVEGESRSLWSNSDRDFSEIGGGKQAAAASAG